MKHFEQINELLIQIPLGVAFVLCLVGIAAFILMFTDFGKRKMGMAFCASGYVAGAAGALSWMLRFVEA